MDKSATYKDVFDNMEEGDFFTLTPEQQAEFLEHASIEDFDELQDAMLTANQLLETDIEALEVAPLPQLHVTTDAVEHFEPATTKELTDSGLIRLWDWLHYRIPVYQVAIAASVLIAAFFYVNNQEQFGTNGSAPGIADSIQHTVPIHHADTNLMKTPSGALVIPVSTEAVYAHEWLADSSIRTNTVPVNHLNFAAPFRYNSRNNHGKEIHSILLKEVNTQSLEPILSDDKMKNRSIDTSAIKGHLDLIA